MKYKIDHDYHIHSFLSRCSKDIEQTNEAILDYAKRNNLNKIVLTNHYWDDAVPGASEWYKNQNFTWLSTALPLPQDDRVRFLFGCEADMNKDFVVGLPENRFNDFDFMIISTTHLHMKGFTISLDASESNEERARLWVERLDSVLAMNFPWKKMGIAHPACPHMNKKSREDYLETLELIPTHDMERIFAQAAKVGVGIELNYSDMSFKDHEADTVLRMFKIAKNQGCKFYCGSDSHRTPDLRRSMQVFERAVEMLGLTENDKFFIDGADY